MNGRRQVKHEDRLKTDDESKPDEGSGEDRRPPICNRDDRRTGRFFLKHHRVRRVLVVLSDTHATTGTELSGAAEAAVDDADLVLHVGDFMTEVVLDSFRDVADEFRGVHGNNDEPEVTERLPETTTFEHAGVRIAATHRSRSGTTGLTMLGRQQNADLVVFGHSHRPTVEELEDLTLLNPGSHAQPRGARQSFAVLEPTETGLEGRLVTVRGERFAEFRVGGSGQD
jgi:hypothetical protein